MTTFNLYKGVPWGIGTPHVKYCETDADKMSFLSTYLFRSIANFNIVTPREAIVEGTTNDLFTCGYCAFTIKGEKFYCFVTYVENINEDCCRLELKPDYLFMYINQITWKNSFVNRMHAINDNYKVRTSEGLNPSLHDYYKKNCFKLGNYEFGDVNYISSENKIIVFTNLDHDCNVATISEGMSGVNAESTFAGYFPYEVTDALAFSAWLQEVNKAGLSENIMGLYLIPSDCVSTGLSGTNGYINSDPPLGTEPVPITSSGYITISKSTIETSLRSVYNFSNEKMLYSPEFNTVVLSDGVNEQPFDYYKWGNTIKFYWMLHLSTDLSISIAPCDYNGFSLATQHTFQSTNFPSIPYNCDISKIWYANNKASLRAESNATTYKKVKGLSNSMIDTSVGLAEALSGLTPLHNHGNVSGGDKVISGLSRIGEGVKGYMATQVEYQINKETLEAKISDHSIPVTQQITPASSLSSYLLFGKNAETPLLTLLFRGPNYNDFVACDDFMTQYGYTYNDLRLPQYRSTYSYVKLEQANFICSCNNEARAEINNAFLKGLTVWKQNTMYSY